MLIENIVGWFLIASLVVVFVFIPYSGYKFIKRQREKAEAERLRHEEAIAQLKAERKATWDRLRTGATHVGKTTYDYNADRNRTTVTDQATGKRMSYVHENDSGPDLLTTMIVADMLMKNKDSSAGTVSWNKDVPSVDTTEPERKSYSSPGSYDSGPSYSDSGPSYSSSSDSSPSSDW